MIFRRVVFMSGFRQYCVGCNAHVEFTYSHTVGNAEYYRCPRGHLYSVVVR